MNKYFIIIILAIVCIIVSGSINSVIAEENVIIIYKEKPGPSEKALINSNGGHIKHTYNLIPAISARMTEQAVENLKKNPGIASIEEDTIISIANTEYTDSWGVSHIGSEIVHNNDIFGNGVKIAVIDTGIDYNHEDLSNNYKGGYDFVFNDTDPFDDSYNSHGTHIAGVIAAEKNGIGVVGVAPEADIYAVKVLDGSGRGLASWLIAGIEWAVDNDMDIASISIGTTSQNPIESLQMACDSAYDSGLLLVASAGNTNGGEVTYPAGYDSVIAVTATDLSDQQTGFSSIGPEVELAAPGVDINSTVGSMNTLNFPTIEKYWHLSGTSQAAPHVAGTAALIISNGIPDVNDDGTADNIDVRLQLQKTAIDLGDLYKDNVYGYGLVDARAAVFGPPEIPVPLIELTLIRTSGSPAEDAIHQALSPGSYKITIKNNNMSKVKVEVYQNEVIRKDLSSKYIFTKSVQEVTFDFEISDTIEVIFIPQGKKKTSADIIINKIEGGMNE